MYINQAPVTADQIVSFSEMYGDEKEVFIANVATPRLSIARRTNLVWMSCGPKHNNGGCKTRIDVLFEAISDEALKGCGMHYELYEAQLSSMLINYANHLPLLDRETFIAYVESKGFRISESRYLREVDAMASSTMDEIRVNEI